MLTRWNRNARGGDVLHLVPDDHHALRQLARVGGRAVGAQHVDPGLLEVVDVDHVVHVAERVQVGPAHRALVEVAHAPMLPDRGAFGARGPVRGSDDVELAKGRVMSRTISGRSA